MVGTAFLRDGMNAASASPLPPSQILVTCAVVAVHHLQSRCWLITMTRKMCRVDVSYFQASVYFLAPVCVYFPASVSVYLPASVSVYFPAPVSVYLPASVSVTCTV